MKKNIITIVSIIVILAILALNAYIIVKYATTPVSELPTWVWWLLQNRR